MKIAIFTLPLENNYGGILQAYALQTHLTKIGHEAFLVNLESAGLSLSQKNIIIIKNIIKYLLGKGRFSNITKTTLSESEKYMLNNNVYSFIENHINPKTLKIKTTSQLQLLENYKFDAYIVGSDQVWRKTYAKMFLHSCFFLGFIKNKNIKKITYAASFGVGVWQFSKNETVQLRKLIHKFDFISVRESSAINLCHTYFNVNAVQVIDPTMLMCKEEYLSLVNSKDINNEDIFIYILDNSIAKTSIINKISSDLNLKINNINNKQNTSIKPSISEWIKGFNNAKYVITDSFHGCVFSIIFNKQFIAIGNKERGLDRFESLLNIFKLEDRLVNNFENALSKLIEPICWETINKKVLYEKSKAISFINKSLN